MASGSTGGQAASTNKIVVNFVLILIIVVCPATLLIHLPIFQSGTGGQAPETVLMNTAVETGIVIVPTESPATTDAAATTTISTPTEDAPATEAAINARRTEAVEATQRFQTETAEAEATDFQATLAPIMQTAEESNRQATLLALTPSATPTHTATDTPTDTPTTTPTDISTPTTTATPTATPTTQLIPSLTLPPSPAPVPIQPNRCEAMTQLSENTAPQLFAFPSTAAQRAGDPLPANETITVLNEIPDLSWMRVQTSDGREGWLETRYIQRIDGCVVPPEALGSYYAETTGLPRLLNLVYAPNQPENTPHLWELVHNFPPAGVAVVIVPVVRFETIPLERTINGQTVRYEPASIGAGALRFDTQLDVPQYIIGTTPPYTAIYQHPVARQPVQAFAFNTAYLQTPYVANDAFVGLRYAIPDTGDGVSGYYEILAGRIQEGNNDFCGLRVRLVENGNVRINSPQRVTGACPSTGAQKHLDVRLAANGVWTIKFNGNELIVQPAEFGDTPITERGRAGVVQLVVQNSITEFLYIVAAGE
jgi:hypothetical protein